MRLQTPRNMNCKLQADPLHHTRKLQADQHIHKSRNQVITMQNRSSTHDFVPDVKETKKARANKKYGNKNID